jgi:inorganic pyrophosphatase
VSDLSPKAERGDADPLDICVLSERPINRSEIILNAKVIGGLEAIDQGEADHKIIAVLENDNIWGRAENVDDVPEVLIERLRHYFATYKMMPGEKAAAMQIEGLIDAGHARSVVEAAMKDYLEEYGE